MWIVVAIVSLWATAVAQTQGTAAGGWRTVAKEFSGDRVRAHQRFLSSDALEGRGTGQRGGQVAIEYIAAQFELAGLKPGNNGSYLQPVSLIGVETQPSTSFVVAKGRDQMKLERMQDYVVTGETQNRESSIDAEMVFVGFGITAPEMNWDDYKGLDTKGKVLVMLVNDPPSDDPKHFGGRALTYYGRWTYKYEEATRRGVAGVVLIHTPQSAGYGWEVVRNSWSRERPYVKLPAGQHALKAAAWVTEAVARRMMQMAGQNLDKLTAAASRREFQPVPLGLRLRAKIATSVREFQTANVVGRLDGSDLKLKDQAVVYSAHHDHLGIDEKAAGDKIYNGAVDNASGVAIIIELARAFMAVPVRPRRSILFVGLTAEEGGLRGSEYYAAHPPIPAGKTAFNVNYDGLMFMGRTRDVQLLGIERTTMEPVVRRAEKELNFKLVPDLSPEQGYYYRSDHFSLARVGIPAVSLDLGTDVAGKPQGWGKQQEAEYRKNRYHQPADEFQEGWDYAGAVQAAEIGIYLGWAAANTNELPGWKKGDEFEAARLKSVGSRR